MPKHYKVAIIGAGTAGLSARKEVARATDEYVLIDDGPLGTTCARVGCMPSKVLIQVADDFHRRHQFAQQGISGGEQLCVDHQKVMAHVRILRDRFVGGVLGGIEKWQDTHLIRERASFVDSNTLKVGEDTITADKIIIATGSSPIIPKPWLEFKDHLITTDDFFELETLPKKIAVIGLGVIGIELGQALHRLGLLTVAVGLGKSIGGLTDPTLQEYSAKKLGEEMSLHFEGIERLEKAGNGLRVHSPTESWEVDKALVAIGRSPNVKGLGLENAGIELDERGIPVHDPKTGQIGNSNLFIAGDVSGLRPLLHEAADEGHIVGSNAVSENTNCFKRRPLLGITFSDPNICVAGAFHKELVEEGAKFVTGEVSFEGQGRALVKLKNKGRVHIYAEEETGKILGSEIFSPAGEHLAHLIAWLINMDMDVNQALTLPFYHPVIEEGLRTALRDARKKLNMKRPPLEIPGCGEGVPCP